MAKGMFVDTSICTGCKACQVACKEWNGIGYTPSHFRFDKTENRPVAINFTGNSYDNTGHLNSHDWRHVRFIEQFTPDRVGGRWLFMSDSCKHCNDAGCLNVCPTDAIIRTDMGNVFVQQETCIGCKYCIAACPWGVISFNAETGTAQKCTLCNDRIHNGLGTACSKACPTGSIQFGDVPDLRARAQARLSKVKAQIPTANIYGLTEAGGLNVFYLLLDKPSVYEQPENPVVPTERLVLASGAAVLGAAAMGLAALFSFRERGKRAASASVEDAPAGEVKQ